jgi:exopolyphosphatase/guanosine-5'-triphosphate,3'-diphosphate pyrophosphatase
VTEERGNAASRSVGIGSERPEASERKERRAAAIDCGTNSIRLLVADVDPVAGTLTDLDRRMRIVRLGQGVDRTGRLAPEALERTFAACREYAQVIRDHAVPTGRVRFVATSATRDAANRDDFVRGVRAILGVEPEVITGDQEAELSFTGATRELTGAHGLETPYLVVDIGGGSTEFVLGERTVTAARSMDIGCVRLTERHLLRDGRVTDPPTPEQIAAITADIDAALAEAARTVPFDRARTLVGLAGSVTTVAAIALGLPAYDSAVIHHSRVSLQQVRDITHRLLTATHAERAAIPVMHEGRVDVIGAGSLVLLRIMERTGAKEVVVSEHDILDGIAFSVA